MDPIENIQSQEASDALNMPITKTTPVKKIFITGSIIGVVFVSLFGYQLMSESKIPSTPIVANPTIFPTPTPNRTLSALATQSSFLALEQNVASVSSAITNYIIEDPSLSPPVLELSLGF